MGKASGQCKNEISIKQPSDMVHVFHLSYRPSGSLTLAYSSLNGATNILPYTRKKSTNEIQLSEHFLEVNF